jgi:hypothetical protein
VSRRQPKTLVAVTDEILAEVTAHERVKTAEINALRDVTPSHQTEIGQLLHKVAEDLRHTAVDVTYEDLNQYVAGGMR